MIGENMCEGICSCFPEGKEPGGERIETGRMRDCFPCVETKPVSGLSATSCLHVETCARETASDH